MKKLIARSLFSAALVCLCISRVLAAEIFGGLRLPPAMKPWVVQLMQLEVALRLII